MASPRTICPFPHPSFFLQLCTENNQIHTKSQLVGEDESEQRICQIAPWLQLKSKVEKTDFYKVAWIPEKMCITWLIFVNIFYFYHALFQGLKKKMAPCQTKCLLNACWQQVWNPDPPVEGRSIWAWWSQERIIALQHKAWHHSHMGTFRGCMLGDTQKALNKPYSVSPN